jgi:hypothetical protein
MSEIVGELHSSSFGEALKRWTKRELSRNAAMIAMERHQPSSAEDKSPSEESVYRVRCLLIDQTISGVLSGRPAKASLTDAVKLLSTEEGYKEAEKEFADHNYQHQPITI